MTRIMSSAAHQQSDEEMMGVRKGPWTAEEDSLLRNYVNIHGEGHWNAVARAAGNSFFLFEIPNMPLLKEKECFFLLPDL